MPAGEKNLSVLKFLALGASLPVVDARSPGEYARGHIPGAVNIPLFDDDQRAEVGTVYKKEGNLRAVIRGIDLAAPEMSSKLSYAVSLAVNRSLLVYCWRGGMRSEAMAWLFSLILKHMAASGYQVTDLEGLASHRGSAFGAMGQPTQPSSEHFANMLFDDIRVNKEEERIWLEDESRNIGTVFMPDCFYEQMQQSTVIALMMSIETRIPRLIEEYASFPIERVADSVMRISKRLGGNRTREALEALGKGDFGTAIRITLDYYDRSYNYGLSKRPEGHVIYVYTGTDDIAVNAAKVLEAADDIR
jgi:tRNA 2-selenouridine synthase